MSVKINVQYVYAFIVGVGIGVSRMYLAWLAAVRPNLNSYFGKPISNEYLLWIDYSTLAPPVLSCILGPFIVHVRGVSRKNCLQISAIVLLMPWIILLLATVPLMICIGQAVAGLAYNTLYGTSLIYICEMANKEIRGRLCVLLFVTAQLIELLVSSLALTTSNYMALTLICTGIALGYAIAVNCLPESKFWLVESGILGIKDDNDVNSDVRNLIEIDRGVDKYIKVLLVTLALTGLTQFGDVLLMTDKYQQEILNASKSPMKLESGVRAIFDGIQLASVLLCCLLIDTLGRKPLLIASNIGCLITLLTELIRFYFHSTVTQLPLIALILFQISHSFGIAAIPYVLLGELFPAHIKADLVTFNLLARTVLNLIMRAVLLQFDNIPFKCVYIAFAWNCICLMVVIVCFIPETKRRNFATIQYKLIGDKYLETVKK